MVGLRRMSFEKYIHIKEGVVLPVSSLLGGDGFVCGTMYMVLPAVTKANSVQGRFTGLGPNFGFN